MRSIVDHKFSVDCPEGVEELTVRGGEKVGTTNVEDKKWRPTLVDEDWRAI